MTKDSDVEQVLTELYATTKYFSLKYPDCWKIFDLIASDRRDIARDVHYRERLSGAWPEFMYVPLHLCKAMDPLNAGRPWKGVGVNKHWLDAVILAAWRKTQGITMARYREVRWICSRPDCMSSGRMILDARSLINIATEIATHEHKMRSEHCMNRALDYEALPPTWPFNDATGEQIVRDGGYALPYNTFVTVTVMNEVTGEIYNATT